MSFLLWANARTPVPVDDDEIRSTVTIVDQDEAPSTMEHVPDKGETFTDEHTDGGLTSHQVSSYVIPKQQGIPIPEQMGASSTEAFDITNRQVSASGTAAQRESVGIWGHGTLQIQEAIDPIIVDGTELTEEYFKVPQRNVQDPMVAYMTPSEPSDNSDRALAAGAYANNARQAVSRSMWEAFNKEQTGIG